MHLNQLQGIIDWSFSHVFNNIFKAFVVADSIIDNIEKSFSKLHDIYFMEYIFFDQIAEETTEKLDVDFVTILVKVLNEYIRVIH